MLGQVVLDVVSEPTAQYASTSKGCDRPRCRREPIRSTVRQISRNLRWRSMTDVRIQKQGGLWLSSSRLGSSSPSGPLLALGPNVGHVRQGC